MATWPESFWRSRLEAAFAPLPMVADRCVVVVGEISGVVEMCGGGGVEIYFWCRVDRGSRDRDVLCSLS